MEAKDFSKSKIVKVECSFCGKGMECPEEMLKTSKKHMCHECFIKMEPQEEEMKDVHVDIPTDHLPQTMGSKMADTLVEEAFPGIWNERKEELKDRSKKELAIEMFGAGVYLGVKTLLESMREAEEGDEDDDGKGQGPVG